MTKLSRLLTMLGALLMLLSANVLAQAASIGDGDLAWKKQDYEKAKQIWLPLAEKGNEVAQFDIGKLYVLGQGVPQDYNEAFKWYKLAAAKGYAKAQYNLGVMYASAASVASYQGATDTVLLAATNVRRSITCALGSQPASVASTCSVVGGRLID